MLQFPLEPIDYVSILDRQGVLLASQDNGLMLIQLDSELLNSTAKNNCWFNIQIHSRKLRPGWHEFCYTN